MFIEIIKVNNYGIFTFENRYEIYCKFIQELNKFLS